MSPRCGPGCQESSSFWRKSYARLKTGKTHRMGVLQQAGVSHSLESHKWIFIFIRKHINTSPSWAWPSVRQNTSPGLCARPAAATGRNQRVHIPFPRTPELEQIPAPFTLWGETELTYSLRGPEQVRGFLFGKRVLGGPGSPGQRL